MENNDLNLSYKKLITSIPKNNYKKSQKDLIEKGLKEWRWRFIKINDKMTVEISYLEPKDKKRYYLSKNNEWVERTVNSKYDNYVVKQYFCYSEKKIDK